MNQSKWIRNERDAEEGKVSSVTLFFAGRCRSRLREGEAEGRRGGEGRPSSSSLSGDI